ncbi:restriction endonuclease subunit S [Pseudomonas sp. PDM16]|uniref:restriction endonuclease subunit S n=1 Tax=Pseudomonas sp. PDM16 TaxID=2769292 RepID=UPI001783D865|nr:restriction endonuclease subunit S [Pseudomonas sp. PDM16]MBD9414088.1 restriction endonuclease subunit S [Pseudomonas sp. PDM16]
MSHYKPYPAYKDSGVEWLGRVPEHWQIKRLKHIANVQTGVAKGKDNEGKDTIEVPYLRVANVQDGYLSLDDVATIEIPREDLTRYSLQPGDVLMNEGGDFDKLGRGSVWQGEIEPCIHQNHVFAVRPTAVSSAWLNAFTGSLAAQFYFMGRAKQSTNLASISSSNIMELPVAIPPANEVDLLLAHLDRETVRIDALIEKKTRFIELLREKRQALITHAVTKGLDPNVKMKDSGVEWLGEVPEHWRVMAIKHIVATPITDGPHETPEFLDEGVPFVSAEAVSSGRVDFAKIRGFISQNDHERYSQKYCPKRGDIFMIKSGATTGVTAIVETDDEFNIWSPLAVIRCGESADPYFVLNFMRSRSFQEAVALSWSYGTQQNIGMGVIGNLAVTVPPLDEQKRIALSVHAQCVRLDDLIDKTECSIALLKERRSALITAAVTGQIDLREAV